MAVQDARCTNHVTKGFKVTGGNRRPRRITISVAGAQGRKGTAVSTKSRTQAWCIPSERMTNTVWVASIRPKPVQMDAIHIQREAGERAGLMSMARWYSTAVKKKQPCSESPGLCSGRSGVPERQRGIL